MSVFRLNLRPVFPPAHLADKGDGLLAVGGDLSRERLLKAYAEGIFPWYSPQDPILWWSPDPRALLLPNEFHLSKRNRRYLRKAGFIVHRDKAFAEVVKGCALTPRRNEAGTWITPEMQDAYISLHRAGFAHSFAVFRRGELVGGLYGISLGRCFFAESMFSLVDHASKAALSDLVALAQRRNFHFIDVQFLTSHLEQFGVREISRRDYLLRLKRALKKPTLRMNWEEL
ncbi:MAG: leucyl/phenylalanyl-tRNA--protein transferase [Deltaproteobacteria bacterium]|nr:leucyl/phenylalanyl-tRNA--protein transferase [Deltaproteobacteria bacterium]